MLMPSLAPMMRRVDAATPYVEIVKGAETVAPPGTVTEGGVVAAAVLLLPTVITAPAGGAGAVSVTVLPVVEKPPKTDV